MRVPATAFCTRAILGPALDWGSALVDTASGTARRDDLIGHRLAWSAICGPVVALGMAAYWLNLSGFGPLGVSVLAAAAAMLGSRLFPAWLCWLAVLSGVAGVHLWRRTSPAGI
ncbi:MAG: hypothetical protein QOH75_888 [Actinomycetota bacterium]|nr:hypothetical protein [Actinomycetota bacterium]